MRHFSLFLQEKKYTTTCKFSVAASFYFGHVWLQKRPVNHRRISNIFLSLFFILKKLFNHEIKNFSLIPYVIEDKKRPHDREKNRRRGRIWKLTPCYSLCNLSIHNVLMNQLRFKIRGQFNLWKEMRNDHMKFIIDLFT